MNITKKGILVLGVFRPQNAKCFCPIPQKLHETTSGRWTSNKQAQDTTYLGQLGTELQEDNAAGHVDGGPTNHHSVQLLRCWVRPEYSDYDDEDEEEDEEEEEENPGDRD